MTAIGEPGKQIPLFLFKNHRMSFYYWCKMKKELGVSDGFFVVTMDYHNDLAEISPELKDKALKLDLNDLLKVERFAKNKLGRRNDDYIFAAMEAGLVNDILIISPDPSIPKDYTDSRSVKHNIFHCLSPDDLGGPRGLLTDSAPKRNKEIITSIGFPRKKSSNIILDIDLDYFTYSHNVRSYVMDRNNIKDIFSDDSLIWWIRGQARAITIAKEYTCRGGAKNSRRILNALWKFFLS